MLKVNWLGKQGVEVVTQLIGVEATSFGCDWRPVTLKNIDRLDLFVGT